MGMPVVIPFGTGGGGDTENWPVMGVPVDIPPQSPTFEPPIILAVPVGIIDVFLREAVMATSTVLES